MDTSNRKINRKRFNPNCLLNEPAIILGNGSTLPQDRLCELNDYFTIGLNRILKIYEPTILMWQDIQLYLEMRKEIENCNSILYCKQHIKTMHFKNFHLFGKDFQLTNDPKKLYGVGSTGPLAFQLAKILGCKPIIILGCDGQIINGKTSFYGVNTNWSRVTQMNCMKGLLFMIKNGAEIDLDILKNYTGKGQEYYKQILLGEK